MRVIILPDLFIYPVSQWIVFCFVSFDKLVYFFVVVLIQMSGVLSQQKSG